MTYNIHPIFVHFPIAFLFLYSIIKIIPLETWFPNISWKQIERILLFFGVLGALASLVTGDIARHIIQPSRQLVGAHSTFAYLSTWIYGILLFSEIISIIKSKYDQVIRTKEIQTLLTFIDNVLSNVIISRLLALLGLISISVTGILGGVMVYGPYADPFSAIILKLLGIGL